MIKRKYVRTRALKEGMRIDQSIIDKMGRTLIARGTLLDDYMIESLGRLGVSGVYTSEGEEDEPQDIIISEATKEKIEELKVNDRSKLQLTESVKKRVSEGIQYLYNNTASENFTSETKGIAEDLMRAIDENDAIAIDIGVLKVSDEYTFKHSVDVATMAMVIAKQYGMSEKEIYELGIAGLLHDVGKSRIPNEVLNKPGKLTEDEFALMKQHTLFGYAILKDKADLSDAIRIAVLQHHEKLNGRGYPLGLASNAISRYAKILSVVDIYDALVTERPYKKAYTHRTAVELLMSMTEELDVDMMRKFLGTVILYPVGSNVKLSNGETAKVVENYPDCIMRPKVVGLRTSKVYNLAKDVACANLVIL